MQSIVSLGMQVASELPITRAAISARHSGEFIPFTFHKIRQTASVSGFECGVLRTESQEI
jgi:hypothetical protein